MATLLPRAARSAIAEASPRSLSRVLRTQSPALKQCISRPFSTTPRFAATAASPSYVKRSDSSTPTPSTSSTPKAKPTSSSASTSSPRKASSASIDDQSPLTSLTSGMADTPVFLSADEKQVDWSRSFHGLSSAPFAKEAADILMAPIPFDDVEVKPDGIIYLPEIKYRRILNRAFGPGGWGLAPRGETIVTGKSITREYALLAHGRLVSVARGEQDYFSPEGIPTATEGCKSNALMRCCKDLGVASELWDPRYIRTFMKEKAKQIWVEHVPSKKKKQIWLRKDDEVRYPYKESKYGA